MSATVKRTDAIWFFDNLARVRVSGDETDGRLAVVELEGPMGHMPPLHIHHREDEAFVVLEGQLNLYVGDAVRSLHAGDSAFARLGVPHTFRVESDTARWLAICAPAGFERFVAAVGEPAETLAIPTAPHMPSPERMEEIGRAFGIELIGPPGTLPS